MKECCSFSWSEVFRFNCTSCCNHFHAILQLTKNIYKAFDNNEFTLGIFIDLSKGFDTVDHKILLGKLTYFGISETYIKWFKSYLELRQQYIACNINKQSILKYITCGVPQGSILGPLLFLLYVNELHLASNINKPVMFADDTCLFFTDNNISQLFRTVNHELKHIQNWFNANKLSLNTGKTQYSFFHANAYSDRIPLLLPKLPNNNELNEKEQ